MKEGKDALIYSFVARNGGVVLAEHTTYSGNFSTIAVQCLQKLPSNLNNTKFTYSCDGYTFNYLIHEGFTYMVVADDTCGRQLPFGFLDRVKEAFKQQYAGHIGDTSLIDKESEYGDKFNISYSLDKEFGPRLKEHMQYCIDHPEEMNKIAKIKAQVSEVKNIMMDNIEKVLDRGEKIELLVDKTESLRFQADNFQRQGRQLRRKLWLQNLKTKLMVLGIVLIIIIILWLSICHGFSCS